MAKKEKVVPVTIYVDEGVYKEIMEYRGLWEDRDLYLREKDPDYSPPASTVFRKIIMKFWLYIHPRMKSRPPRKPPTPDELFSP